MRDLLGAAGVLSWPLVVDAASGLILDGSHRAVVLARDFGARLAVVQQIAPGTLAAWTPPELRLECRVFYQFPWFPPSLLDELTTCLRGDGVDVVLRDRYVFPMPDFERQVAAILQQRYCLEGRAGSVEVWLRAGRCRAR